LQLATTRAAAKRPMDGDFSHLLDMLMLLDSVEKTERGRDRRNRRVGGMAADRARAQQACGSRSGRRCAYLVAGILGRQSSVCRRTLREPQAW